MVSYTVVLLYLCTLYLRSGTTVPAAVHSGVDHVVNYELPMNAEDELA